MRRRAETRIYAIEGEPPTSVRRFWRHRSAVRDARGFVGHVLVRNREIERAPIYGLCGYRPLVGMTVEVALNGQVTDRWSW